MDFPQSQMEHIRHLKLIEGRFEHLSQDPRLGAMCEDAKAEFGVESAAVTLITRDEQLLSARAGTEVERTPRALAFCNHTILQDDVFVVRDARLDSRFRDNPLTTSSPFIRFYAGAPLIYQEDIRLGAFCLLGSNPRDFSLGEKAELMDFAERAVSIMIDQIWAKHQ